LLKNAPAYRQAGICPAPRGISPASRPFVACALKRFGAQASLRRTCHVRFFLIFGASGLPA
jgi:hypothetical protein